MELVSTNGKCALDDDAAATLVRWTNLRLNFFHSRGSRTTAAGGGTNHRRPKAYQDQSQKPLGLEELRAAGLYSVNAFITGLARPVSVCRLLSLNVLTAHFTRQGRTYAEMLSAVVRHCIP
jgi:hypothetical protein